MTFYNTDAPLPDRPEFDFYETEPSLIINIINIINNKEHPPFSKILDTGCGTGLWGSVARLFYPDSRITGIDIDYNSYKDSPFLQYYNHIICGDYLTYETNEKFNFIIGNPPYGVQMGGKRIDTATPFVIKSYELLEEGGHLLYLLRINFQASLTRYALFDMIPPLEVYVCNRRPNFKEKGTNIHDYALFHWVKGKGKPNEYLTKGFVHERENRKESKECLKENLTTHKISLPLLECVTML